MPLLEICMKATACKAHKLRLHVQEMPITRLPPVAGEFAHATIKAWGGPLPAAQPGQAPGQATYATSGASTAASAQPALMQPSKEQLVS